MTALMFGICATCPGRAASSCAGKDSAAPLSQLALPTQDLCQAVARGRRPAGTRNESTYPDVAASRLCSGWIAGIASAVGMIASRDTILERVKTTSGHPEEGKVRVLGVDDWARSTGRTIKARSTEGEVAKRMGKFVPYRKISETFLDFSGPLLLDLPSEALEHQAREALQVSFTVWNAVIFAGVLNDDRYLNEVRRLTAYKPQTSKLIEQMIARKRSLFGSDARLIGTGN
jgi:hypothetical protein